MQNIALISVTRYWAEDQH